MSMKCLLFTGGIMLCFILSAKQGFSQQKTIDNFSQAKPALFNHLQSKTNCSLSAIDKPFGFSKGRQIILNINADFTITGEVLEKTQAERGVENINIRCSNYNNALLSLSRITQEDGSVKYTGILHDRNSSDVLLLINEDGHYAFKKQQRSLLIADCPLPE